MDSQTVSPARVKIVTSVPTAHAPELREALGEAGAGCIGAYSFCSFSIQGQGRFMPSSEANPFIGSADVLETVVEERIEVTCNRSEASEIVVALRAAHPYEEPVIDMYALLQETDL